MDDLFCSSCSAYPCLCKVEDVGHLGCTQERFCENCKTGLCTKCSTHHVGHKVETASERLTRVYTLLHSDLVHVASETVPAWLLQADFHRQKEREYTEKVKEFSKLYAEYKRLISDPKSAMEHRLVTFVSQKLKDMKERITTVAV